MKKKIKDMTSAEMSLICEKYKMHCCIDCPLATFVGYYNEPVSCAKEVLEKEVKIDG